MTTLEVSEHFCSNRNSANDGVSSPGYSSDRSIALFQDEVVFYQHISQITLVSTVSDI